MWWNKKEWIKSSLNLQELFTLELHSSRDHLHLKKKLMPNAFANKIETINWSSSLALTDKEWTTDLPQVENDRRVEHIPVSNAWIWSRCYGTEQRCWTWKSVKETWRLETHDRERDKSIKKSFTIIQMNVYKLVFYIVLGFIVKNTGYTKWYSKTTEKISFLSWKNGKTGFIDIAVFDTIKSPKID